MSLAGHLPLKKGEKLDAGGSKGRGLSFVVFHFNVLTLKDMRRSSFKYYLWGSFDKMGKRVFVFVSVAFVLFLSGIAMLPIGVSLKESLWIAREMWDAPTALQQLVGPEITLEIDYDDYRTLGATRIKALEAGVLLDSFQVYVPASLTYQGVERKAAIKLKGMRPTHWSHPIKWSFRIVLLKGEKKISNMKTFSLQTPAQRGYYIDALYHDYLEQVGVINLQYDFVRLNLGGMNLGKYMIEEFFDAPILTRLGKSNGPIIRFDFEGFWAGIEWYNHKLPGLRDSLTATYYSAPIKSYKYASGTYKEWDEDSEKGKALLESFRLGEKSTKKVFNLEKLAHYFAVNTLFGNQHPALLTNLRFYYDPATGLLEPIGYDIEGLYSLEKDTEFEFNYWPGERSEKRTAFVEQVFSNSKFNKRYLKALNTVTDSAMISKVLLGSQSTFEEATKGTQNPNDRRGILWENAAAIRKKYDL